MIDTELVRSLRAFAGDLAVVGRAIGATVARARQTFRPSVDRWSSPGACEVPGCGAPATYPCICEPVFCERHWAEGFER